MRCLKNVDVYQKSIPCDVYLRLTFFFWRSIDVLRIDSEECNMENFKQKRNDVKKFWTIVNNEKHML